MNKAPVADEQHGDLTRGAGDYDDSFALALACKNLGLAVDLAGQAGVPVELSAVVEQVYRRARAQYGDAGGELLTITLHEDLTRPPPPTSARSWVENPLIGVLATHDPAPWPA